MPALFCDVLVVGGGPCGSTAAALLAERGWDVVQIEKDRHPRFHIGESLLPRNLPIFRRLGLAEGLSEIGVPKHGADFTDPHSGNHIVFNFADALQPDEPSAFQVLRQDLDRMLFENAERRGVRCFQETRLTAIEFDAQGARARVQDDGGETRTIAAKFVIDASGRDSFLARKFEMRRRDPNHASAAVFGHFAGVEARPGEERGNISIYWFEQGWFWVIPLRNGITSVGMVCWPVYLKGRSGSPTTHFWETVARTRGLAERMAAAESRGEIQGTGNFSYRATQMTGERFLLAGDAYAFIDPVFSSGVYLAMQGAEYAAESVDGVLREPHRRTAHLRRYERRVRAGLDRFSWFIYRFTNPAFRYLFLNPTDHFSIRAAVISVLSGDVFGRTRLWPQLAVFRMLYALASLAHWGRGAAFRQRLAVRDAPLN